MSFNLNKLVQPECGAPNPLVRAAQQIAGKSSAAGLARIRPPAAGLRYSATPSNQMNFAKEFVSSNPIAAVSGLKQHCNVVVQQQQQQQQAQQPQSHTVLPATVINYPIGQQLRFQQAVGTSSSISAGEQLEEKYRQDIIAQTDAGRHDDVEFWQSISQAYIGPTTFDNIAKLRSKRRAENQTATTTTKTDHEQRQDSDKQAGQTVDEEATLSQEELERQWDEGMAKLNEELAATRLMESTKFDEYLFDERNPLKDQFEDPFSEGLKRLEQGDIPSAALLFEAAVQREPNDAQAWRYLGTTQAQNENDKSAIKALNICLKLDPRDQQARLAISVSLVNETQHREACKHLLEWLIAHERYKNISASLAEFEQLDASRLAQDPLFMSTMADSVHYEYVRDKFVEAARMSPNDPDPDIQNSLGVLFNMRAEYDKAVDCFKAALSVQSGDSLLWNRLGATLANSNKSDEAVIAYRRALEIAPGFLRSRYNLAISLIHLSIYDEAAHQLVQILNTQAAGRGSKSSQVIRTRSITSTSIWNTLRTVATLMNRPELYPVVDGRDLAKCNELLITTNKGSSSTSLEQP